MTPILKVILDLIQLKTEHKEGTKQQNTLNVLNGSRKSLVDALFDSRRLVNASFPSVVFESTAPAGSPEQNREGQRWISDTESLNFLQNICRKTVADSRKHIAKAEPVPSKCRQLKYFLCHS